VFLRLRRLGPVMQMRVIYDLKSADGQALAGRAWNTIHKLAPPLRR
jgi:hypothetical protein